MTETHTETNTPNTAKLLPDVVKALGAAMGKKLNSLFTPEFRTVLDISQSEMATIRRTATDDWGEWPREQVAKAWAKALTLALSAYLAPRRYHVLVIVDNGRVEAQAATRTKAEKLMRKAMNRRPHCYGSITPHPATSLAIAEPSKAWEYGTDEKGNVYVY